MSFGLAARRGAAAYSAVGVETGVSTADPHKLILMLFDGAILQVGTAAIALENRRLWEQEREQARTLQRSFLPVIPRTLEGLELGELYAPSQQEVELGGDFYDLFPVEHGRFGVVIGDVCGKGLTAAVYTAMAKYALRHYAFDDPSPAEVMRKTNRSLCRQITEEGLFISIIYAMSLPG